MVLLAVELDDELLLHLGVDDLPRGQGVHQDLELARDELQPGRHGLAAGEALRDLERRQLPRLLADLDDVVLAHPEGRDVDLAAVDLGVAMAEQLPGGGARGGQASAVDDVVPARLEDLQQHVTGLARLVHRLLGVAVELLLQHAVHAAGLLLLAQLQQVFGLLRPAAAVLAGREGTRLERALRPDTLAALEEQLHLLAPAAPAVGSGVTRHRQTLLRFGGRQPLCGCGVTSEICPTSRPAACSERIAVSRPEPGPLTNTSTLRMPCSIARRAAASAASCAANGVDLREPLKPTWPDEAQEMTAPVGSVIDTMVLLKVLLMCACPWATFLRSLRRTFFTAAPARAFGGISQCAPITSDRASSYRRPCASGPCGYERWSGSADRARAGPGGGGCRRKSRSRPCGGCPRRPRGAGHPQP